MTAEAETAETVNGTDTLNIFERIEQGDGTQAVPLLDSLDISINGKAFMKKMHYWLANGRKIFYNEV